MFRGALFIAREDLLQLLRQRDVILWVFLMPGLFFYFIGSVTGGVPDPSGHGGRPDPLVLVTSSPDDWLLRGLAERLGERGFEVVTTDSPGTVSGRLRLHVEASPEVAPPGARVARGEAVALRLENLHTGPGRELYELRVQRAIYATAADLVLVTEAGAPLAGAELAAIRAAPRNLELRVTTAGRHRVAPTGFAQAVPGIIVMFTMLVLLTTGTHMMTLERELGLLRRLASAPIRPEAIVAGKWLGRMALGIVQIAVGMALGAWLFGVSWRSGFPALLGVLVGWAAFNAALAILLANLASSSAQGAAVGMLVTMLFSALGGCWWPIEITPAWMQGLARILPSGWAMDAMHRIVSFGDGSGAIVPHVVAMMLAAATCAALAARRFRFQ